MSLRRRTLILLVFMSILTGLLSTGGWASLQSDVRKATAKFRDLQGTAVVVYANEAQLRKMGKSYARSFEIKKANIFYKSPDKFRMEGALGMVRMEYITNGDTRIVRVPSIRYSKKDDLSDEPGKLRACIDIGILNDHLWAHHEVRLLNTEKTESGTVYCLGLARNGDGRRNQKIWVDAEFRLLKREKYNDDGSLKARYIFKDHKHVGGVIWTPVRTETYNNKAVLVGVSELRNIKVNQDPPDSKFR